MDSKHLSPHQSRHSGLPQISDKEHDMEGYWTPAPQSSLLFDRLREKKAESWRHGRKLDHGMLNKDCSGLSCGKVNSPLHAEDRASRASKGSCCQMGFRELEDHISKINKQNFDLKLELYHRRQRAEVLEGNLRSFKVLQDEHEEAKRINDDLLQELEKRDLAIAEAVTMICYLEDKVETLELALVKPSQQVNVPINNHSGYREQVSPSSCPSSPPVSQHGRDLSSSPLNLNGLAKQPSFLRTKLESTAALKDLFQVGYKEEELPLPRPLSVFSKSEDAETVDSYAVMSPALSILSKSSFISVYGNTNSLELSSGTRRPTNNGTEPEIPERDSQQFEGPESAKVQQWLGVEGKSHRANRASLQKPHASPLRSIEQVLQRPMARQQDGSPKQVLGQEMTGHFMRNNQKERTKRQQAGISRSIFGQDPLPPTPDTLKTLNTTATNSSESIVMGKGLLNVTSISARGYESLLPSVTRPEPVMQGRKQRRIAKVGVDGYGDDTFSTQVEYNRAAGGEIVSAFPATLYDHHWHHSLRTRGRPDRAAMANGTAESKQWLKSRMGDQKSFSLSDQCHIIRTAAKQKAQLSSTVSSSKHSSSNAKTLPHDEITPTAPSHPSILRKGSNSTSSQHSQPPQCQHIVARRSLTSRIFRRSVSKSNASDIIEESSSPEKRNRSISGSIIMKKRLVQASGATFRTPDTDDRVVTSSRIEGSGTSEGKPRKAESDLVAIGLRGRLSSTGLARRQELGMAFVEENVTRRSAADDVNDKWDMIPGSADSAGTVRKWGLGRTASLRIAR